MPRTKKVDIVENTMDEKKGKTSVKKKTEKATTNEKNTKTKKTTTKVTKKTATKTSTKATSKTVEKKPRKVTTRKKATTVDIVEYYDLPYRYDQTVVKTMYQTPETLFIYWDIADEDRSYFTEKYGNDFFNNTTPVLLVHNKTMNYTFEVEINDFANNWYLHINDTNCEYTVELGRKPKYLNNNKQINLENDYLFVASSNEIESPNDHILFDRNLTSVDFKNVKTNATSKQDISYISVIKNICELYGLDYTNIDFDDYDLLFSHINLNNPSSGNPTSTFK